MVLPSDPIRATHDVLERIRRAWYAGKPIVPIVGAGFSAHSGFPILNSICRYLARLTYAIQKELLLPNFRSASKLSEKLTAIMNGARERPIEYLMHFNWPDRFDLTQKVARYLLKDFDKRVVKESRHQVIEAEITTQFAKLAEFSCSPRAAQEWKKKIDPKSFPEKISGWDRWAIQGDWRRLIQFFTDYQDDQADSLFARFGFLRSPGQGHRYFALLAKLLSIHHIFTFNFDDLIERTLTLEDIPHRIFGMEHGKTLPHRRVAEEVLSVIKMHGSHHSILIDERLDRPLKEPYINRFYELAGQDPLLLVLGCSGDDRRLADILRGGREKNREAEICWIYFEPKSPASETNLPVWKHINDDYKQNLYSCATNSPAAFLRHLLFDLCGRFPTSARSYSSHPWLPMKFGKTDSVEMLLNSTEDSSYISKLDIKTSEDLLALAAACANKSFAVIWICVEALHTLAGIVGAIIDACRLVDAELPPAVMPLGEGNDDLALARLEHALQRHHYAVFIDAVGTYGSSSLMHHSSANPLVAEEKAERFRSFLTKLINSNLGQSIVVASVVTPAPRRQITPEEILQSDDTSLIKRPDSVGEGNPLCWTCLACVRRTRALPSVRRLLAPLVEGGIRDERNVDEFLLKTALKPEPIRMLEGGDVWFDRAVRDDVYKHATRLTSREMLENLKNDNYAKFRALTLAQSLLIGFLHRKIASTYFSFEFMQSRDAASFMEYTYHRISSVRYFSRAIYLLDTFRNHAPELFDQAKTQLDELGKPSKEFDWQEYFGDPWSDLEKDSFVSALGRLRIQREDELEALLSSWKECEHDVRSQIPAEQLLHWIDEILESEEGITRMSGVFIGRKSKTPVVDNDSKTKAKCADISSYFLNLRLRITLERGDYAAATEQAKEALRQNPGTKAKLDLIEVLVRAGGIDRNDELKQHLEELRQELAEKGGIEAGHRFRHLMTLYYLRGTSWMADDIKDGVRQSNAQSKLALLEAEKGIHYIRGHGALLAEPLDGMIVSSGAQGGAYGPYRSVFRALKGRAIIGELLAKDIRSTTMDTDLADFRRAMRQFDQAKAGLQNQYVLLRGWADLHAAESALLLVRRTFDRTEPVENRLGRIRAKLLSCRMHLHNAMRAVRLARRNAFWWRHCYQIMAQYHIEFLFWDLFKLEAEIDQRKREIQQARNSNPSETWKSINRRMIACGVDLYKRYEKCLAAIVGFADYSLSRQDAFRDKWLRRTLIETVLASAVAVYLHERSLGNAQIAAIVEEVIKDWKDRDPRLSSDDLAFVDDAVRTFQQTPNLERLSCEEYRQLIINLHH